MTRRFFLKAIGTLLAGGAFVRKVAAKPFKPTKYRNLIGVALDNSRSGGWVTVGCHGSAVTVAAGAPCAAGQFVYLGADGKVYPARRKLTHFPDNYSDLSRVN